MGELVKAALDAEVGVEGEREDERVGRQVAARVVADQQHRPVLGDAPHVAHVAAEPEAGEQPDQRQVLADVVGIAVVEVGGEPVLDALEDRAGDGAQQRATGARGSGDTARGIAPVAAPFLIGAGLGARAGSWHRPADSRPEMAVVLGV